MASSGPRDSNNIEVDKVDTADSAQKVDEDRDDRTTATTTTTEDLSGSGAGAGLARRVGEAADTVTESGDEDEDDESVFGGVNPTRDALQEGILGLLRPTVDALDNRVSQTRAAQEELKGHIGALQADLLEISRASEARKRSVDLEAAVEKLNNSKRRVVVVANLLQGAQDRLNRVHQSCLKETARRRTQLEPSAANTSSVGVSAVSPKTE